MFVSVSLFGRGSGHVAQVGLELIIFLPSPPEFAFVFTNLCVISWGASAQVPHSERSPMMALLPTLVKISTRENTHKPLQTSEN
jgi:hypothetical protein